MSWRYNLDALCSFVFSLHFQLNVILSVHFFNCLFQFLIIGKRQELITLVEQSGRRVECSEVVGVTILDEVTEYGFSIGILEVKHIVLKLVNLFSFHVLQLEFHALALSVLSFFFSPGFQLFVKLPLLSTESFQAFLLFLSRADLFVFVLEREGLRLENAL